MIWTIRQTGKIMNSKRAITAVTGGLMIISLGAFANGQSTLGKVQTNTIQRHHSQKWGRNLGLDYLVKER